MGNPVLNETSLRLRSHTVHLEDRSILSVSGVKDVGSFNDREVCLATDAGALVIEGTELHITRLDLESGQVTVEGEVGALVYEDDIPERKQGLFSRLFR